MKLKQVSGIVLSVYTDSVMGVSWIKLLTNKKLESFKLPQDIGKYKQSHLINPSYLLEIEIIKTAKNWIVKDILRYEKVRTLEDYDQILKYTQEIKLLHKYIYQEQETNILPFIYDYFNNKFEKESVEEFEVFILEKLGFSNKIQNSKNLSQSLLQKKIDSGLI